MCLDIIKLERALHEWWPLLGVTKMLSLSELIAVGCKQWIVQICAQDTEWAVLFAHLLSCVKMPSNTLPSFNSSGKSIFFYHVSWVINNLKIIKQEEKKKKKHQKNTNCCNVLFYCWFFQARSLVHCVLKLYWTSLLLHVQTDFQMIHFASSTPVLFIIIMPGWSRDITLLLHICAEDTECFWFSCLTLSFP